jgi:hypothetical protein
MPTETAQVLARKLEAQFLANGNFVFAGGIRSDVAGFPNVGPASAATELETQYPSDAGFVGLAVQSVGYEEGNDVEPTVHVYVTKGSRSAEYQITSLNERVTVRVERVGKVTVRPEAASTVTPRGNLYVHNGRIACGSSCAPSSEQIAGTLGALVQKATATGANRPIYALSNNHVFAGGNHTPVNMPILAPANMDASPNLPAPREICRHSEICELRSGDPAFVTPVEEDVAIARIVDPALVSSWQGDDTDGYDTPTIIGAPAPGLAVKKFGRTSGLTFGTVESAVLPFPLPYNCKLFKATVWIRNAWVVRGESSGATFAIPGDSGSLVTDDTARKAIGVIFAASLSGDRGYMIPMQHLAQQFGGLRLIRAHGV